jgi:hypothetical protein
MKKSDVYYQHEYFKIFSMLREYKTCLLQLLTKIEKLEQRRKELEEIEKLNLKEKVK